MRQTMVPLFANFLRDTVKLKPILTKKTIWEKY